MSKITLIDGYSILHRAFYGVPDLTNSEGLHTNAIYGFLNIMFRILDDEKPDYLVVAMDAHAPTFRHAIFKEYKGTRKPMPEELREQLPVIRELLKAMNILVIEKAGLEADDILGTIGKRCEKEGIEVTIVSGDRDLLQLASDTLKVRIPKTKAGGTEVEDYNTADVIAKFGVEPVRIIDLKALMGDSSDNIPGVPSVGEKTAVKLLTEFGSVDGIYENIENVKPPRIKQVLIDNRNLCELSRTLAKICTDGDVEFELQDALVEDFYTEEAYEIMKRLNFKKFLACFENIDNEQSEQKEINIIKDEKSLEEIILSEEIIENAGFSIAVDKKAYAFVLKEKICYVCDDEILNKHTAEDVFTLLCKRSGRLYCGNYKDLLHVFNNQTVNADDVISSVRDIVLGAYLLNPLKNDHNVYDIALAFLNMTIKSASEIMGKRTVENLTDAEKMTICANEAFICAKAGPIIENMISEKGMKELFENIEMPLCSVLYDMEKTGIRVREEELKTYGEALLEGIARLQKNIYDACGEEFNIQSPKQLGVILFEKLKLPAGKKTKTGYSTSAEVLEKLAPDYSVVSDILEYRTLTKLKSTYADGLANYIADDGRIHGTFNQTITATGRISSTEPNLQNIPVRMDLGRQIRKIFVPEDGYCFIDADYSQVELRILASMSGDENLIRAYNEAADIHRMTASQVFGKTYDEVTEADRRNAKAVNFGIVYGISGFGLGQDLNISRKEAEQYIKSYFEAYPGVKKYLDDTVKFAKDNGYVSTSFGRIRPIPELSSGNFMQRSFGERVAMNSPIQGTAADIMKIAMIDAWKELKKVGLKSRIVLQVHDELLVESAFGEEEQVDAILKTSMENAAKLAVKLEVDVKHGMNWMEAH